MCNIVYYTKKKPENYDVKTEIYMNVAMLDITNSSLGTVIFDPKEMSGILDLRSSGYHKIKQGMLQQNLSTYYRFE